MNIEIKLKEWKSRMNDVSASLNEAVSELSNDQINATPAPGKWSIGQHIEHLIIINESYYPVLEMVSSEEYKPPWQARVGFLVRLFGNMIYKSIQPSNMRPTKTMPVWEPSTESIDIEILDQFQKHQDEFYQVMESTRELLEENIVIPSPANSTIQYYLPKAFEIIVAHEERHLRHILELVKAI